MSFLKPPRMYLILCSPLILQLQKGHSAVYKARIRVSCPAEQVPDRVDVDRRADVGQDWYVNKDFELPFTRQNELPCLPLW